MSRAPVGREVVVEEGLRGDRRWPTIGHLLQEAAEDSPDRLAIVDGARSLSFAGLQREARAFGRSLLARGTAVGDRVAVWAPNRWEFVVAALGAHSVGAVLVPINTRYKGREATFILERSQPRLLVMVSEFLGNDYVGSLAEAGWSPARTNCDTLLLEDPAAPDPVGWAAFLARGEAVDDGDLDARLGALTGEEISDILFTSGTTGEPKGVTTTHAQNLRAYWDWSTIAGFRAGDRYSVINPFFHAFGYKVGWLSALMHRMTIFPHAVLDVPSLLREVERERIEVLPGPPALYHSILEERRRQDYDLSSLRLSVTGAASITPSLIRRMKVELGFERITTCYGLTESTGIATITRADDDDESVATTSGRPLPGVELAIVADDGHEPLGAGLPGEVVVRGYSVMKGYLGSPAQTATAIDAGGWLHTGDIGMIDDPGRLRITDRKDDMFTVGGFNAYPAEIEQAIERHPRVSQVAVIGAPDARLGSVGAAYVVLLEGGLLDEEELLQWCREEMANFKVPRIVRFVPELPRNATGKVLKHALRDRLVAEGPRAR